MHPLTAVPYSKDVEMTCVVRCRPSSYIIINFSTHKIAFDM